MTRVEEVFALVGGTGCHRSAFWKDFTLTSWPMVMPMRGISVVPRQMADLKIEGDNAGAAITMARCCHPLPGEAIVGIFTTGKGITVHKVGCTTLGKFSDT